MALFNFGKKKEAESIKNKCCPEVKEGEICCIKVLGAGCKSCHEQYENAKQAVKDISVFIIPAVVRLQKHSVSI